MTQRPRLQIAHTTFAFAFSLALYVACNAVNLDRLVKWFRHPDGTDYMALSAYLFAGLCLFLAFFLLLAHRRTIKASAIVLTVISAAVTYFISKYDVALDSSMMRNVIYTDSTEVGQLISKQMLPYFLLLICLPLAIVLTVRIEFEPRGRYLLGSAKLFVIALIAAVSSLYWHYTAIHRAANVSNKYIVYSLVPINFLSSSISLVSKSIKGHFASNESDVEIRGTIARPGNLVVVLAVGESSRRKSFSVYGYNRRDTTPILGGTPDLHLLNGVATRGTTLDALPEILAKDDIKLTTLVSKLGIPTSCYVNYSLYDNCAAVGERKVSQCRRSRCYDEDVVPLLAENLSSYRDGYRFVVLHLGGGSHGPVYSDRYPAEFQRFQPLCKDADVANQCTLEQLLNAYDNSILYVDFVLGEIIRTLDTSQAPYVLMYLSDHGESLMEDGLMFHGMPPGRDLPKEQAEVPLIVKSSVPISIIPREAYSQPAVFDTVLDLFGIETPMVERREGFIRQGASMSISDTSVDPKMPRVLHAKTDMFQDPGPESIPVGQSQVGANDSGQEDEAPQPSCREPKDQSIKTCDEEAKHATATNT